MNEQEEVLKILGRVGAVITNSHIVYTSGKHGKSYINKDAIYPHTHLTSMLCSAIALEFSAKEFLVDVVIAPAIGAVILSQWVAYHLTNLVEHEVLGIYAEKEGTELISSSYGPLSPKHEDKFVIKRGYDKILEGKRVLVVEDVLNTGGSVKKVIEATRATGGGVVGLGVLCNRGGITSKDVANPPKLFSLVNVKLNAWDEADCPHCFKFGGFDFG